MLLEPNLKAMDSSSSFTTVTHYCDIDAIQSFSERDNANFRCIFVALASTSTIQNVFDLSDCHRGLIQHIQPEAKIVLSSKHTLRGKDNVYNTTLW